MVFLGERKQRYCTSNSAAASCRVQATSLGSLKWLRKFKPSWNITCEDNNWRHLYLGSERSGLTSLEKQKLGKSILPAFHTEFAQQEQSLAQLPHMKLWCQGVPPSPVVLECPSEAATHWQEYFGIRWMATVTHGGRNASFSEALSSACKAQRFQGWYKRCWEERTPPFPSDRLRWEKPSRIMHYSDTKCSSANKLLNIKGQCYQQTTSKLLWLQSNFLVKQLISKGVSKCKALFHGGWGFLPLLQTLWWILAGQMKPNKKKRHAS